MIRPAVVGDAGEIAALYTDIRLDTVPLIHPEEEVAAHLAERIIPRGSSFVWEESGRILGWVDVHESFVDQLYCRRGATGRGIGKRLLDFAKAQCPEGLQLYTFMVNEGARRFYAREGFREVEYGDGSENEERQPDVRLQWTPS